MANPCAKSRPQSDPYEVWEGVGNFVGWTWKVLSKQRGPEGEAKDPYSRWFCAVDSPMTFGMTDMGDVYATEVKERAIRVK